MSQLFEVRIPDIGDDGEVDVVEVLVQVGDTVAEEDSLIMLESDKASMEVPSPVAGVVRNLRVSLGDKARQGDVIAELELSASAKSAAPEESAESAAAPTESASIEQAPAAPPAAVPTVAPTSSEDFEKATEGADFVCDVAVLGSGPGGYTAAFRAADLGLNVVMVERYASLGGVCLNVGCIPSKALLHMAKVLDETRAFADHGMSFGEPTFDLDKLRSWKDSVVAKLTGGLKGMSKQRKVQVVHGTGKLLDAHRMEVETEQGPKIVAFKHGILAAGSRSVRIPGWPYDDERLMDSTGALELVDVPKRLLVIGGGIIGLEMATVYHALGSEITIVELLPGIMPGADRDLVRPLERRLKKSYARILTRTKVTSVESTKAGLKVQFEGEGLGDAPAEDTFDRILLSVGRAPNGKSIGADAAGVHVDERGFIAVDKQLRTNVPNIFAIGDLVGQPMLAHKAVHEGKVAAEAAAGHKAYFDARVIPSVAYTDPEVAWVGVTETQAKAEGIPYEKASFPWTASGRALAFGRSEGTTKLLFDPTTHRVIGGGIVGPHAGDLLAEIGLAIEMGCDAADIGLTIHAHPTLSETVAMSAEVFEGTITDLYLPKKKKKG